MTIIHPQATQYRSIRTDNDNKFNSFIDWAQTDNLVNSSDDNFAISLFFIIIKISL